MSPDSAGSSVSLSPSLDSFWVVVAKNEDGAGIFTRLMDDGTIEAPPFFHLPFINMKDGKIIERKLSHCNREVLVVSSSSLLLHLMRVFRAQYTAKSYLHHSCVYNMMRLPRLQVMNISKQTLIYLNLGNNSFLSK